MYFAVYIQCNKNYPQILAVATTSDEIGTSIRNKLGDENMDLTIYCDGTFESNGESRPYEVGDIEYEHIISYEFNSDENDKLNKNNALNSCTSCSSKVSIFKTSDTVIDFFKVLDAVELSECKIQNDDTVHLF